MKRLVLSTIAFFLCGIVFSQTTSTTLDGSASFDPDGTISSYSWRQISGPNSSVITKNTDVKPVVTNLIAGTYSFQLTVTDNKGATGLDTVNVFVSAQNKAPHADAGPDQTIQIPGVGMNTMKSIEPDVAKK